MFDNFKKLTQFSRLHDTTFFKIRQITVCLLEANSCSMKHVDPTGSILVIWATLKRDWKIIDILLLGRV